MKISKFNKGVIALGITALGVLALLEKNNPGINTDHQPFDEPKDKKEFFKENVDTLKVDSAKTKQISALKL